MPLYKFKDDQPKIGKDCFIAPSADVIGRVEIADNANVWFGCVLRGDINKIVVGENTNIQDLSMLHVIEEKPCLVGANVTVGHKATLHACTVEDNCLIGMDALILDGALIRKNSVVAGGSVVPPGKDYPEGSLIMGNPTKVVRELTPEEKKGYGNHYKSYIWAKDEFLGDGNLEEVEA